MVIHFVVIILLSISFCPFLSCVLLLLHRMCVKWVVPVTTPAFYSYKNIVRFSVVVTACCAGVLSQFVFGRCCSHLYLVYVFLFSSPCAVSFEISLRIYVNFRANIEVSSTSFCP
jgi:hypothetical protein